MPLLLLHVPSLITTMATNSKDVLCGGYPVQFVGSLPRNLQAKCSICTLILKEPHQVNCCGYRFCKNCLDPLMVSRRCMICPSCNGHFSEATYDTTLEKKLNECIVYCTHKSEGCRWTGELQSLERHEVICLSKPVTCAFCKKFQGSDTEMKKHVKSCRARRVPCQNGCGAQILHKNVDNHVRNKCPLSSSTAPSYQYKLFKVSLNEQNFLKKVSRTQKKGSNPVHRMPLGKHKKGPSSGAAMIQQKEGKTHIQSDFTQSVHGECICKHCKDFEAPPKKLEDHEKFCRSKSVSTSVPKPPDQAKLARCPNGCNGMMNPNERDIHIRDHCPRTIFHCSYCNDFVAPRRKLKKHEGTCRSRVSSIRVETVPACSRAIYSCDFAYITGRMPATMRPTQNFTLRLMIEPTKEQQDLALTTSNVQTLERENSKLKSDKAAQDRDVKKVQKENRKLKSANDKLSGNIDKLKQEIMKLKADVAAKDEPGHSTTKLIGNSC